MKCQVLYTQVDCDNNACTSLLGLSVSLTKAWMLFTQKIQSLRFSSPISNAFFLQASLVVAVLVLLYCLYVVQDWLDMLTHDQVLHHRCLPLAAFSALQQHHFLSSLAVQNLEPYK